MSEQLDLAGRVLAALGDAVMVIGRDGCIHCWSGSAEQLYGLSAAEVVGQRVTTVFPELGRMDPEELAGLAGAERLEAVMRMGNDGALIAVTATPLYDESGEVIGTAALTRPMGGWLDPAERSGRPRRQWHRTLGGIVQDLVEEAGQDPRAMDASDELARMLVGQARRLLPSAECCLAVVPREHQDYFQILAGAGPWAERQIGNRWPLEGTLAGRTLNEGRPQETTRLAEQSGLRQPLRASLAVEEVDARAYPFNSQLLTLPDGRPQETTRLADQGALRHPLLDGGIVAGRLVPLWSARPLPDGRRALGVLGFYRTTRTYFTPYERRLIDEFARLVSLSLQRAELLRSAEEAAARLQTGVDVAVELAHTLQPDEVIGRLVKRAAGAVDAERVTLLLIEGDEAVVVDAHDRTGQPAPAGARFPISELLSSGEPVIQRAVRDRRPRMTGAYEVKGLQAVSDWGQAGPRHTLTLPLVLGGSVNAVLLVNRLRDQAFRREDALTLQLVGNVAVLALRNARLFAEAQEASRARSDFLNMAGHELRTPLTVIKGYLSMLSDGSLGEPPEGLRQPVELLASKAEELGGLVDDLLFTSRLEAGRLPARPQQLDLREAARGAARRAEPRVRLLGGVVDVEVPPEPLVVRADPEHVARVLDNLVNNALTYRRPGQPAWVRLEASAEANVAMVSVEDHGRGIPPAMRDRIFERFVRGDEAGAPGTGLGLYISRQLAARHGGSLELDGSVPGEGSRFSLRLPQHAAGEAVPPVPPLPQGGRVEAVDSP